MNKKKSGSRINSAKKQSESKKSDVSKDEPISKLFFVDQDDLIEPGATEGRPPITPEKSPLSSNGKKIKKVFPNKATSKLTRAHSTFPVTTPKKVTNGTNQPAETSSSFVKSIQNLLMLIYATLIAYMPQKKNLSESFFIGLEMSINMLSQAST